MDFSYGEIAKIRDTENGVGPALALPGANQRQKFVAGLLVVTESSEHSAGDGLAVLFFDAAHLHAEVAGFDDYADALRGDFFLDGLGNLAGEALLYLQAAREHVNDAGDLAEAQDALVGKIGDVRFAEEWQEMVFAEAEKFDVLDDDHFVVGHAEGCAIQDVIEILVVTAGQELQGFFEALGRFAQTFAIRILTNNFDDFAHVEGDPARIDFLLILFVQQNFFSWLGHEWFPSRLSPAYSKLLLPVS